MQTTKQRNITFNLELNAKPGKDGLHAIFLRITEPREYLQGRPKMIRVKTEVNCLKEHFGSKKMSYDSVGKKIKMRTLIFGKWISNQDKEAEYKNLQLEKKLQEYKKKYSERKEEDKYVTGQHLLNTINTEYNIKCLVTFLENKIKNTLNYGSQSSYKSLKVQLLIYLEKSRNINRIDFRHVNANFLRGFQVYLESRKISPTTVYEYFNRLRAVFNAAIKEQVITPDIYPFKIFTMPRKSVIYKERLTLPEMKAFEAVTYHKTRNSSLFDAQQIFLLSFYCCGMRAGDLISLKVRNIKNGRIIYNMRKGVCEGKLKSILIDEKIEKILNHFITEKSKPDDFILPYMPYTAYDKLLRSKNAAINALLKEVAKDAGIEKNVTLHVARHSFASILLKRHKNIKVVQDALGHSSPLITQRYAGELDNDTMDEILKDLWE